MTPLPGGPQKGKTPLEVMIDAIAEVNRLDPTRPPEERLANPDYRNISDNVSDFLLNKERGLEQFYEVVRNGGRADLSPAHLTTRPTASRDHDARARGVAVLFVSQRADPGVDDCRHAPIYAHRTRTRALRAATVFAAAWASVSAIATATDAHAAGLYFSDRGVRSVGRGGAFVAGADDLGVVWSNPAGLADAGMEHLARQHLARTSRPSSSAARRWSTRAAPCACTSTPR